MPSSSSHSNNFNFLRLLAAVMVWYGHCCTLTSRGDPLTSFIPFETFGSLGVTIFFIISGYFIAMSYDNNKHFLRFIISRVLRILPALFAVVLFSIFIVGPLMTSLSLYDYFANSVTWRYLRCLLIFPLQYDLPGVPSINNVSAINGSLWTLQHEVRLYAVVAVLGVLGILRPRLVFILLLGLLSIRVYGIMITPSEKEKILTLQWGKLELTVRLATQFAMGAFLYLTPGSLPLKKRYFILAALLAAASVYVPHTSASYLSHAPGNLLFDIAFSYIVIYLGFLNLPLLPLASKWGDFSYGFYLYAFPMQRFSLHLLGGNPDFKAFLFTSFSATFLCAVASWHIVEKPALAMK